MTSNYTAIVKKDGDWWVGWIEEVPGVNAQEKTKPKLMASLKDVLAEALDGLVPTRKLAIVFKGVK
jgi:predicted RNase H-like HicB family nuclease